MVENNNIKVFRADVGLVTSPRVWAFVKHGLDAIRSKIGDRAKWTPMHVRQAVISGNSELWLAVDGEKAEPLGFYVLSLVTDPFIAVPTVLFVWIAYGEVRGLVELCMPEIKKRAKELGVDTIEMISPRRGWMRRLARLGWDVADVIYSCSV